MCSFGSGASCEMRLFVVGMNVVLKSLKHVVPAEFTPEESCGDDRRPPAVVGLRVHRASGACRGGTARAHRTRWCGQRGSATWVGGGQRK